MTSPPALAMKSLLITIAVLLLCSILPLLGEGSASPKTKTKMVEKPTRAIAAVPNRLLDDTLFIITAPTHWERNDWLQTSEGMAIVVDTALLLDTRLRDESERLRNPGPDQVPKRIQHVGTNDAFGVAGDLWVYGKLVNNSEAVTEVSSGQAPLAWVPWFTVGIARVVRGSHVEQNAPFASNSRSGTLLGTLVARTIVRRNQERRGAPTKPEESLKPDFGTGHQGVSLAMRF
jgi:hypothetical protein